MIPQLRSPFDMWLSHTQHDPPYACPQLVHRSRCLLHQSFAVGNHLTRIGFSCHKIPATERARPKTMVLFPKKLPKKVTGIVRRSETLAQRRGVSPKGGVTNVVSI